MTVNGTRDAGDEIQVLSPLGGDPICIIAPDGSTLWECANVPVHSGASVAITAVVSGEPGRSATVTVSVLTPPTLTTNGSGVIVSAGSVHGTAYPGALVTATASNGSICQYPADASGAWGCVLSGAPIASGDYTVSARQDAPGLGVSNPSQNVPLRIDTNAPAAPTLTAPGPSTTAAPGERVNYGGSGENGGIVSVYAVNGSGGTMLCSSPVVNHNWSCLGTALPLGNYTVTALQKDAVGNTSPPSTAISLNYAAAGPDAGPRPEPNPQNQAAPILPQKPGEPRSPSATPSPGHSTTPAPEAALPPGTWHPRWEDPLSPSWNQATPFTNAIQPPLGPGALPGWLRSLALAFAALLLLALPARLLVASSARYRARRAARGHGSVFGRNRARAEFETPPRLGRSGHLLTGAAGLLATTALVALSTSVADQGAYLRMSLAMLLALILVNVTTLIPLFAASRMRSVTASLVFTPWALLLVAAATLVSRLLELHPALLFGLVFGVLLLHGGTITTRGRIAVIQIGALAVLGMAAWLLLPVFPTSGGVAVTFATEAVNTIVLASIGSAAIGMLPVGTLPGRAIFAWSRLAWFALTLGVGTLLFALLLPIGTAWQGSNTGILVIVLCGVFAALSAVLWLWQRYIEPSVR